jgi:lactoylglutathione lyase
MIEEVFPILSTPDMPRALGFYRDLLGGVLTYRFPADGDAAYVSLTLGGSTVGIAAQDQPGVLVNDRVTLWAYVADCDDAIARIRSSGAEVVHEPADQPWGERMATVRDPDGNALIVAARETARSSLR